MRNGPTAWRKWSETPVVTALQLCLALYCAWFTVTLFVYQPNRALGPEKIMPYHAWGWVFLGTALLKFAMMFVPERGFVITVLRCVSTLTLSLWAVASFIGMHSLLGQPAFIFAALMSAVCPFVQPLINRRFPLLSQNQVDRILCIIQEQPERAKHYEGR